MSHSRKRPTFKQLSQLGGPGERQIVEGFESSEELTRTEIDIEAELLKQVAAGRLELIRPGRFRLVVGRGKERE